MAMPTQGGFWDTHRTGGVRESDSTGSASCFGGHSRTFLANDSFDGRHPPSDEALLRERWALIADLAASAPSDRTRSLIVDRFENQNHENPVSESVARREPAGQTQRLARSIYPRL